MNINRYYQCKLKNGDTETTGWIEARGAKVGAIVELLPTKEAWEIVEVYDHGLPADILKEHQRMNRKSLPSVESMH